MTEECGCAEPEQNPGTGRCRFCGLNCAYLSMFHPDGKTKRALVEKQQAIIDRLEADLRAVEAKLYYALKTIHETPDVTQIQGVQRDCDIAQMIARHLIDHIDQQTSLDEYEMRLARTFTPKPGVTVRFRPATEGGS